jgi:hypothetical protein
MSEPIDFIKTNFEYNNQSLYNRLSTCSFRTLLLNGIWRTMKSNGEPEYVLIEDMAPDHIARSIKKAKADNNSLIIDILASEVERRSKRGEMALSKLNNNNNKNTEKNTMSTSTSNNIETNQHVFRYALNDVLRVAGKDNKVRDVIVTFRQEALAENGYRAAYRYKVKGSNGDNSALYSQRDMIEMENRAVKLEKRRSKKASKTKTQRDVSQKFEVNKTYGRYTIVNHDAVMRFGKRKDGTLTVSNSVTGHRYDVTVDGGKTVVTFTQTELSKAIEREAKAIDTTNAIVQSELDFNSSENSQLRAENNELKRMIAEIHEKLNMRAATTTIQ